MNTQQLKAGETTMHEQTYLTTADLAQRWQISANTLRNWRFRGIGPRYFKPSGDQGKALYRVQDILAWEEKHTISNEEGITNGPKD